MLIDLCGTNALYFFPKGRICDETKYETNTPKSAASDVLGHEVPIIYFCKQFDMVTYVYWIDLKETSVSVIHKLTNFVKVWNSQMTTKKCLSREMDLVSETNFLSRRVVIAEGTNSV